MWPRNLLIINIHGGIASQIVFCGLDVSSSKCFGQYCNRSTMSLLFKRALRQHHSDQAPELLHLTGRRSEDVICRIGVLWLNSAACGAKDCGTFTPMTSVGTAIKRTLLEK